MSILKKLVIDFVLILLFIGVMSYSLTGNMLHELIGLAILIGFFVHIFVNRKYFLSIGRIMKASVKLTIGKKTRNVISLVLNILLAVSVIVMLLSSLAISNTLYNKFALDAGHYELFKRMHIFCANVMCVMVGLHVILHLTLIKNVLVRNIYELRQTKVFEVVASVVTIALVALQIRQTAVNIHTENKKPVSELTSHISIVDSEKTTTKITTTLPTEKHQTKITTSKPKKTESMTTTTIVEPTETLDEFLSKLNCTGCRRNCNLANPRCMRGVRQAEQAEDQYNEIYKVGESRTNS